MKLRVYTSVVSVSVILPSIEPLWLACSLVKRQKLCSTCRIEQAIAFQYVKALGCSMNSIIPEIDANQPKSHKHKNIHKKHDTVKN